MRRAGADTVQYCFLVLCGRAAPREVLPPRPLGSQTQLQQRQFFGAQCTCATQLAWPCPTKMSMASGEKRAPDDRGGASSQTSAFALTDVDSQRRHELTYREGHRPYY